jgi:hypothetical protein
LFVRNPIGQVRELTERIIFTGKQLIQVRLGDAWRANDNGKGSIAALFACVDILWGKCVPRKFSVPFGLLAIRSAV